MLKKANVVSVNKPMSRVVSESGEDTFAGVLMILLTFSEAQEASTFGQGIGGDEKRDALASTREFTHVPEPPGQR